MKTYFQGFMENKKNNAWEEEREIRIKVSPKRVLKLASFFVLLIFAFYLGRWTMPETALTEAVAVEAPEESSEPESSFSFTGWVTGLFAGNGEEETDAPESTATPTAASESSPAAEPTTAAPAASETQTTNTTPASSAPTGAAAADEGDVITTYAKVALALTSVKKDWKETWGKVTSFDLTVKNNEAGTVKSSYILMSLEGYEDAEKKIIFGQTIKEGKTLQYTIPVPKGFAYNAITAGDLSSVDITIQLYDASDKLMSTTTNAMNLQG